MRPSFGDRIRIRRSAVTEGAGIAGLAIGFGAQTMVHDFINGFFILFENQYDLGDVVRIAGVKGTVEKMSLRQTVLRDEDGTVHIVPNSAIQIVSNTTRDWSQFPLRVVVSYNEASDKMASNIARCPSYEYHSILLELPVMCMRRVAVRFQGKHSLCQRNRPSSVILR